MVKQITIDNPTIPNLFSHDDALITSATTAIDFVSDDLEKLAVQLISNNELRVKSGSFCIGGHYGYIPSGSYETCYVSPGNIGFRRKDLIVAKYTRVGTLDYIGIQIYTGVPSKGEPVVPTYSVSDLNADGKIREIPLYVVELNGMDIISITSVFETLAKKYGANALLKTSFFTGGTPTRYNTILETNGIVTATVKMTAPLAYINNVDGVWEAETAVTLGTPIEAGYTAEDIIIIPSVVATEVIKAQVVQYFLSKSDGIWRINAMLFPYMFLKVTTPISADFSVTIRYKKVKL